MPRLPKHPSTRARRNKTAGARTLSAVHDVETPELPDLPDWEWHPMTERFWSDIWASPMAPEYDESDLHGLWMLAALVDQYWSAPTAGVLAEIRLQRQCFGLTPLDRRRLQWEIDRGDEADRATRERRNRDQVHEARTHGPPAESARKHVWVDWVALTTGRDPADLDALTKKQLVEQFGPDASSVDPLAALTS